MIGAGEVAGKLEEALEQVLSQMKKTHELTSRIRGALIYPVPIIRNPEEFRENLRNIPPDRHVVTVVEGFWTAVSRFVDGLLDVFYPPA